MRIDQYAAQEWPEHSRSTWQKLIKQGNVTVNGQPMTRSKYEVKEGDIVEATQPEVKDFTEFSLPIIYEDENVTVIDKPMGILTHAKGALNEEFTVAEFMRSRTTFGTEGDRPGIIHRLDRDTSGVIMCARNAETATMLARQFNQRTVKKTYAAVTAGIPNQAPINIDLPIARHPKKPSTFRVDVNGKHAETYLEIEEYGDTTALVLLRPKTGRTHQLRVHLAHLGTPIVGDRVYGKEDDRLYLHAHQLEITIPGSPNNQRKAFTSPVPKSFKQKVS